ncbi:RNA polymerase subunit sigma-70 [Rhodococcus sp. NPDC003348]
MTQGRGPRQFGSTEHLASEAVAAYVDGELQMNAYLRAADHVSQCLECAAAVDAQQHARIALRQSGEISMPSSLLGALSRIPTCLPVDDSAVDDGPSSGRRRMIFSSKTTSYSLTTWRRRR